MTILATTILLCLIAGVDPQTLSDIYNFPVFGALQYDLKTTYGSVTIVHKKMVLAAAENLVQLDPKNEGFIFTRDHVDRLFVVVGSDLMTPPDDEYDKGKIQQSTIEKIIFGRSSAFTKGIDRNTLDGNFQSFFSANKHLSGTAPATITGTTIKSFPKEFVFNPFQELQWDVAIILLKTPLKWSPYVLPIVFHWLQYTQYKPLVNVYINMWAQIERLELDSRSYGSCSVPGWSTTGNNEIVYHRVVYVRFRECADAICGAYPSSCLRYLNIRHHFCFKSTSFADSCVLDQGAPVFCSFTKPQVLGIAVKTFECGSQGLPTVFTRIDAIQAFAALSDIPKNVDGNEPDLSDPNYTEKQISIGPYR